MAQLRLIIISEVTSGSAIVTDAIELPAKYDEGPATAPSTIARGKRDCKKTKLWHKVVEKSTQMQSNHIGINNTLFCVSKIKTPALLSALSTSRPVRLSPPISHHSFLELTTNFPCKIKHRAVIKTATLSPPSTQENHPN